MHYCVIIKMIVCVRVCVQNVVNSKSDCEYDKQDIIQIKT